MDIENTNDVASNTNNLVANGLVTVAASDDSLQKEIEKALEERLQLLKPQQELEAKHQIFKLKLERLIKNCITVRDLLNSLNNSTEDFVNFVLDRVGVLSISNMTVSTSNQLSTSDKKRDKFTGVNEPVTPQQIVDYLSTQTDFAGVSEIGKVLNIDKVHISKVMKDLLESGAVMAIGKKKGTKYALTSLAEAFLKKVAPTLPGNTTQAINTQIINAVQPIHMNAKPVSLDDLKLLQKLKDESLDDLDEDEEEEEEESE